MNISEKIELAVYRIVDREFLWGALCRTNPQEGVRKTAKMAAEIHQNVIERLVPGATKEWIVPILTPEPEIVSMVLIEAYRDAETGLEVAVDGDGRREMLRLRFRRSLTEPSYWVSTF